MSDLKQPPSPRAALNIILNGHGATCGGYALSCKKCDREHEAVLVLRAMIEASEVVPAEPEQAGKTELSLRAARLLRNHVAGENVDDLMHQWADDWDAATGEPYDATPAEAGKAQGWIPVGERDPRDNEKVLVCNFRGEMRSGSFDSPTRDVLFRDGFWHLSQCTHWQPASPPTKDTTNG